ncbi:multiple epidermal growth factor-like domains protein 8 [Camarhynchus parvulus]|uniref:multiple epidermal growth factor-like domains protein 8 n=1 Tax=Geospiza parvula TaxID=87175 RepID=UPI00123817A6|nr:multiple epidermal growth factor-like domains protein 8 [Camarhynchus parvulus]
MLGVIEGIWDPEGPIRDPQQCPPPCSSRSTCSSCLAPPSPCAWCPSARRCFLFAAYLARYPYGGCRGWSDSVHSAPQCRGCSQLGSCQECLSQHGCGWCGRRPNPALGSCFEGDFSGLHHFPNCSAALAQLSDHLSDHSDLSDHVSDHSDHVSDHGDPNDHWGDPNDHLSDPDDLQSDPNDHWGDPDDHLSDPDDLLSDPNDHQGAHQSAQNDHQSDQQG